MDVIDPYGLPGFPGEGTLSGWIDHSDITLRNVRVFTCGTFTATLIHYPAQWDLIVSDGAGGIEYSLLRANEIAFALSVIQNAAKHHVPR